MPKFIVSQDDCVGCGACAENCPASLYDIVDDKSKFKVELEDDCVECDACLTNCPFGAIIKNE